MSKNRTYIYILSRQSTNILKYIIYVTTYNGRLNTVEFCPLNSLTCVIINIRYMLIKAIKRAKKYKHSYIHKHTYTVEEFILCNQLSFIYLRTFIYQLYYMLFLVS